MCSNILKRTTLSAFFEPRGWAHRDLITSTHPPHLYVNESLETFFLPLLNSTRIMLGNHPFNQVLSKGKISTKRKLGIPSFSLLRNIVATRRCVKTKNNKMLIALEQILGFYLYEQIFLDIHPRWIRQKILPKYFPFFPKEFRLCEYVNQPAVRSLPLQRYSWINKRCTDGFFGTLDLETTSRLLYENRIRAIYLRVRSKLKGTRATSIEPTRSEKETRIPRRMQRSMQLVGDILGKSWSSTRYRSGRGALSMCIVDSI